MTDYKVELIWDNIERAQVENMEAVKQDALVFDEASEEKAEIVIADLPCSGLGVIGKKADIKYNMTEPLQEELEKLQREILSVVHRYVKPGGTLVYSTCTINEGENIENVRWFLSQYPEFEQVSVESVLCDALKGSVKDGCLQLLPGIHESDGFFIAKFHKKEKGV